MKYILTAILLLSTSFLYSQLQVNVRWIQPRSAETKDTIYYTPDYKLDWDDFRGRPDNNSVALAITSSGFGFTAGIQSRGGKGTLNINVYCYFSKNRSWVKEDKASPYALNHEQHHFDVTYIASARFVEKLRQAKFSFTNYNELLNTLYQESTDELEQMQNDYDGQTKNGRLVNIQNQWNNKINAMLNETAATGSR